MKLGSKVTGNYEGVKIVGVLTSVDGEWLSIDTKPFARMGRANDIRTGLAIPARDIGRWEIRFEEPPIALTEDDQMCVTGVLGGFGLTKGWTDRALAAL